MKTALLSSVSHLNFGVEALYGGLSPRNPRVAMGLNFGHLVSLGGKLGDICLIRIIAYSG